MGRARAHARRATSLIVSSLAPFLPIVVAVHVALAVSLFLPSILLPFALRLRGGQWREYPGRVSRGLFWLQRNGTLVIGIGLAITGALLVVILGAQLLTQPWLLVALLCTSATLAPTGSAIYIGALVLQLAFYALAAAGGWLSVRERTARIALTFVVMNYAAIAGLAALRRGREVWR